MAIPLIIAGSAETLTTLFFFWMFCVFPTAVISLLVCFFAALFGKTNIRNFAGYLFLGLCGVSLFMGYQLFAGSPR
jgi:hypothetical protein